MPSYALFGTSVPSPHVCLLLQHCSGFAPPSLQERGTVRPLQTRARDRDKGHHLQRHAGVTRSALYALTHLLTAVFSPPSHTHTHIARHRYTKVKNKCCYTRVMSLLVQPMTPLTIEPQGLCCAPPPSLLHMPLTDLRRGWASDATPRSR